MRRPIGVLAGAVLVLGLAGVALSQQNPVGDAGQRGDRQPGQMMFRFFGGIQQVIPLADGSIIVVTGTRLMKYDKDLNLVKEVTVPRDTPDLGGGTAGGFGRRGGN